MAAGTASRFVPLSEERPKGLLEVKGEVLIERQIRQLHEAGIKDITVVTGYKAAMFEYLREKYGVETVLNEDYSKYNNTSSIIRVLDRLSDTLICCSDHYFSKNVFLEPAKESYYAALYAEGSTGEYCLRTDKDDFITGVTVGGNDAWYMAGHVFFTDAFSRKFRDIMQAAYQDENVRNGYWEDVYISHLQELPMLLRRYSENDLFEFDTLDELRHFDASYVDDTRSSIIKEIANTLSCDEGQLHEFKRIKHEGDYLLFSFREEKKQYIYDSRTPNKITIYND